MAKLAIDLLWGASPPKFRVFCSERPPGYARKTYNEARHFVAEAFLLLHVVLVLVTLG